jgi:energy-coupling factor transport system permease protein
MRAFVWYERDSFLHRLNPLTKLAISLPVVVIASVSFEPVTPLSMALAALLVTHFVGRVPWSRLLRPLLFAGPLSVGFLWSGTVFYVGPGSGADSPGHWIGPWWLPTAALIYGLAIASRALAIFCSSLIFVLTTDPVQLVVALMQHARVSPRIGYSIFAGYRFMPLLNDELSNIRAAYQVRGAVRGGVVGRVRELFDYAIPLLAISVRRGERVALAMESRAFDALPRRTYLHVSTFSWRDVLFVVGALMFLSALVLRTQGGLPT